MPVRWDFFKLLVPIGDAALFQVRAVLAAIENLRHPLRWLRPFYGIFVGALPLAMILGLAVGLVIWMHTRGVLDRTAGAVELLPTFLAVAVLLELAPIGAGLILASRTGASLGAELASMQAGEQLDALRLLGISPLQQLVGPRVLACILAAPLLHVFIAAVALSSGYLAEELIGTTSWLKYQTAILAELYLEEVISASFKTLVFGALVGTTGCYLGIIAEGGSEGVGQAATNAVVACTLLVLLADVFLVGVIRVVLG